MTVRETFPLPRMNECIDSPRDAPILSSTECNSRHLKLEILEVDRGKTTFFRHYGLFRFIRPFKLKSAQASLKSAVGNIHSRVSCQLLPLYLDEIIAYSK